MMSNEEFTAYMEKLGFGSVSRLFPKDALVPSSSASNTTVKSQSQQHHSVAPEQKRPDIEKPQKQKVWGHIPDKALQIIRNFEKLCTQSSNNNRGASYDELVVMFSVWSPYMEKTLEYALDQGTPYKIVNNSIYIWYKHYKGFSKCGFYRLKRFHYNGSNIVYVMDAYDKLPESFN